MPNLKGVGPEFCKAFPYGIPTDFGRTGFGYRKDLISERPTTWKELWELAAKYKGKTTMIKYDSDIQGIALRYLGYSVNTKDDGELRGDAEGAPGAQAEPARRSSTRTSPRRSSRATAFFAIDYDYDIALAQQSNKNIVWVQPHGGRAGVPGGLGRAEGLQAPAARSGR